jgi:hypothetical protein
MEVGIRLGGRPRKTWMIIIDKKMCGHQWMQRIDVYRGREIMV